MHAKFIRPEIEDSKNRPYALGMKFWNQDFILLVAYPELNSSEMIWSKAKLPISSINAKFWLSKVEELTRDAIAQVNASEFAKYVEHLRIEEEKFKEYAIL